MQVLTNDDVAAHWCLRPQTVRAMSRPGTLRAARIARQYRLHWSDGWACTQRLLPTGTTKRRYITALLTKADLVALTRTSERTVERWIGAGMPTRNVGTKVRINREDARDWLCQRYGIDIGATSVSMDILVKLVTRNGIKAEGLIDRNATDGAGPGNTPALGERPKRSFRATSVND